MKPWNGVRHRRWGVERMKRIMIKMIEFYRKNISSLKPAPTCRFIPTCSEYGIIAIERFGAFKGFFMTLWRFLRCNPWGKGGYDPVPEKKQKKKGKNNLEETKNIEENSKIREDIEKGE